MAITSFFYNSKDGDRKYDASSMENWLKKFFTNGIFTGDFEVKEGTGMAVTIGSGYGNINGKVAMSDTDASLDVSAASGTLSRIDSIVLRRDDTNRVMSLVVIQGSSSSNPTAPAIVRTNGVYDMRLANIAVNAGTVKITQADITDTRTSADCGIVASTVTEMDFSQFAAQFESYFKQFKENKEVEITTWFSDQETQFNTWETNREQNYETWYTERQAAFNAWYTTIVGKLDGDAAAKLTEETTELDERLSLLEKMVLKNQMSVPITTDTGALIVTDDGKAILADWKYKEI